ncbi:ornithine cyclodeaminase family protein [Pseudarthrobacter enclensis]|uniref:ornithine cyclodeaminase family protein n=1 Tax=Pseudarthrobacter enclensis TaxID=993070 RepID=UPI0034171A7B
MLYLNEAQTSSLVDENRALAAARRAFIDHGKVFPVSRAFGAREGERFTMKSGATPDTVGVKIGSYWPGNENRGLPRHGSTIVLLDPETGRVSAVVEAAAANAYRTAAAEALAVETLSRPDSTTLAVIGTGHQAFYEACAVVLVRPIKQILVAGRDSAKATTLTNRLANHLHLPVDAVPVRTAVESADLISTATTAHEPLFEASWVRPGTHISAMGSDAPGKQELPPKLLESATLFCDNSEQTRSLGEFEHAPADALITSLGKVLRSEAQGRTSADQITVFDSSGFALQDLALARALIAAHTEQQKLTATA